MNKKLIQISVFAIIFILSVSSLSLASAAPAKPPIVMDGGYDNIRISPPGGIDATDGTSINYITVSWSSVGGATYYEVYRNTIVDTVTATLINSPVSSPYNDTSANPGEYYFYWVKACDSSECSSFSGTDRGYRALTPPAGINASDGVYTDRVALTWSASTGASTYLVYRNTVNNPGGASQITSTASTAYDDGGAGPGILYYYWVKACATSGCSDFSPTDTGYRAITPPSGIGASDGTYTDRVLINWSSTSGATTYTLYRNTSDSSGGASELQSGVGSTSFNDTSAAPGTIYYYWVKGCSTAMCSDFSPSDSGYRAITPPTGVSATDGTFTSKVDISWSPSAGATYYEIWRNTNSSSGGATQLTGNPTSSPYSDTTAEPGTGYYYWVKACVPTSCSNFSNYDTGYRALTPPSGISASDGTYTDRVEITWSGSKGADYYQIWRNTTNSPGGASQLSGSPTTPPYNDTTSTPGIQYYYWVKACTSATGCTDLASYDDGYRGITAPTGVNASDGTYTDRVQVSWSSSTGATFYEVWRNTSDSSGGASKLPGDPGSSPYNDTTATPGMVYYYWVKGCGTTGCSDFSAYNTGFRAITAPTGVSATDGTFTSKVDLAWNASSGATYYEIWRNTSPTPGGSKLDEYPSSPYSDTTGAPGQQYYYFVKGCVPTSCSDFSSPDTGFMAITPPASVMASDGTYTDRVLITWPTASGATSYEVWRHTSNSAGSASLLTTVGGTSHNDSTATPGALYYYWIKGCATTGCSAFSSSDSGFRALTAPTGVSASDGTYTDRVEISWNPSTGAAYYEIWRSLTSNPAGASQLPGSPSVSPYNDATATPGIQYFYWVKACVSSTGCTDLGPNDDGYRAITPPTHVSATDGTYTDRVDLSWSASTGSTYYEIWRNTTNSTSGASKLGDEPPSSPYSDTTASPGTQYYYFVKGCVPTSCSDFSSSDAGYRALTPPASLTATDGTSTTQVQISWPLSTGATFYEIWRNTSNSTSGASQISSPSTSSYNDITAVPGTLYYYWIKGCATTGCSAFSSSDSGYRAITPPTSVLATDGTSTTQVQISWSSSTGATFYEIWRNTSDSTGGATRISGSPTSSPYNDTTATPGVLYYYWVKGCSPSGCSDFSTSDSGYRAITPPTGVSASDGTYTDKVRITWSASPGATYYQVWRNTINISASASDLGVTPASSPYDDTTAIPNTSYWYWVKACSTPTICSGFSAYDDGFLASPEPPTGVFASDGTFVNRVEITWSTSPGATFYEIWRNITSNPAGASQLPGSPAPPYDDSTATPGTLYYYWIKACSTPTNCSGFSAYDDGYRALTAPTGVSATDNTYTDKVVISWSAVTGATYYEVWREEYQRSDSGIETTLEKLPGEPTTSPYEDTSAIPGLEYAYMIKACSDTGCSDFSDYDIGSRDIAMDYKIYLPLILN